MFYIRKDDKYLVEDYNNVVGRSTVYYSTVPEIDSINSYSQHNVKKVKFFMKSVANVAAKKYNGAVEWHLF